MQFGTRYEDQNQCQHDFTISHFVAPRTDSATAVQWASLVVEISGLCWFTSFNGDFSTVWLVNENQGLAVSYNPCVLNARKLAAIDLVFLGPKLVITEFVAGLFLSAALGIFILVRSHGSPAQIA